MIENPAHRTASTTVGADVVVAVLGALVSGVAYLLPWFASSTQPSLTMDGFGRLSDPGAVAHSDRLHWMIGAAALGTLVLTVMRMVGRPDRVRQRGAGVMASLAVMGAWFAIFAVPEGMTRAPGLWVAVAGALITAVGAMLLRPNLA